jgi:uncharacterized protein (TIGR02266 family)
MPPADETPTILEDIREHEARLGEREEAVWLALNDAAEERAEVLAFAADVLSRIERLPEQRAGALESWRRQLVSPPGPALDSGAFERSVIDIRREALTAREALLARVESELSTSHRAVDTLLEAAREARDVLLRGPAVREAPTPAPTPAAAEPALAVQPTRGRSEAPTPVEDVAALPASALPATGQSAPVIRQNRRKSLEARVDLHSDSNFFSGFSSNISDGGLFIATEVDLPLGTEVDLRFTLPDGNAVASTGVVCWRRPPNPDLPTGLGLQFGHLTQTARDAVARFMKTRDPIFHED